MMTVTETAAAEARLQTARRAADVAAQAILMHYESRHYDHQTKSDGSVVTSADREAERLIREVVRREFASDGISGEEHGQSAGSSGFVWHIDPIDGTTSFVHGVPLFGTLIGIEHDGQMVAGIINMPALGERVFGGKGLGAWHQLHTKPPKPARASSVARLSDAMVCVTSFDYFAKRQRSAEFERMCRAARSTRGWSDCYGHVLVITGRADAVVEPSVHAWDIAATMGIIEEAGGRYTSFDGKQDVQISHGVVSNGHIHDELLQVIRG